MMRAEFFGRSQACLRASLLVKDARPGPAHGRGRMAAYGVEADAYRVLATRIDLKQGAGMRSAR